MGAVNQGYGMSLEAVARHVDSACFGGSNIDVNATIDIYIYTHISTHTYIYICIYIRQT